MAKIKIRSYKVHRTMQEDHINPLLPGIYTVFTDGKGHTTTHRWTSPQDTASTDLAYLSSKHPNIRNAKHVDIFVQHFNKYVPLLKNNIMAASDQNFDEISVQRYMLRTINELRTRLFRSENDYIIRNVVSKELSVALSHCAADLPDTLVNIIDLLYTTHKQYTIVDNAIVSDTNIGTAVRLLEHFAQTEPAAIAMIKIIDDSLSSVSVIRDQRKGW